MTVPPDSGLPTPLVTSEMPRPPAMLDQAGSDRGAWVRARWLRARARNARRQTMLIGGLGAFTFLAALIAFIVIPYGTHRSSTPAPPPPPLPPRADTLAPLAELRALAAARDVAERRLAAARDTNALRAFMLRPPPDTFPADVRARRDSLAAERAALARLVVHAERVPIPASYLAIADGPGMGTKRVRILADSLQTVAQMRDVLSANGADTTFMSLSARATTIGQEIEDIAGVKLDQMKAEIQRISPAPPSLIGVPPPADTASPMTARDSVNNSVAAVRAQLLAARAQNAAVDSEIVRRRQAAANVIPPLAMLGAALILGLVFGFGTALVHEMIRPRVANAREAERTANAPVLARIDRVPEPDPALSRRRADREVSPLIDRLGDNYRAIYTQLVTAEPRRAAAAVIGDDALVTAIVGVNIAAASVVQTPETLLLDADAQHPYAANIARVRPAPGLTDIAGSRIAWPEAIAGAALGRDIAIDLLPSGEPMASLDDRGIASALKHELAHLRGRYDTVLVTAPIEHAPIARAAAEGCGGAILVVRTARTTLRRLAAMADAVYASGVPVFGVVLWDTEDPLFNAPQPSRRLERRGARTGSDTRTATPA